MTAHIYKLRFTAPLHVSANGSSYEDVDSLIHSDTLYSALCTVAPQLYTEEKWKSIFLNQDEWRVRISSAFPYFRESLLLPKPFGFNPKNFSEWDYTLQKAWKKVTYFSWNAFQKVIVERQSIESDSVSRQIFSGTYFLPTENLPDSSLFEFREVPRVTLDRITNSSTLFFYGDITFLQDAGLYFLCEFADEDARLSLEAILRLLGDTGIGGDRTVGKGLFEVEKLTFDKPLPSATEANAHLLLSLYTPTSEEMKILDFQKSFYQIKTRQGWVSNKTFRRQTLRAFSEGSVLFTSKNEIIEGRLQPVLPEYFAGYPIYRYMKAFSIPIKI